MNPLRQIDADAVADPNEKVMQRQRFLTAATLQVNGDLLREFGAEIFRLPAGESVTKGFKDHPRSPLGISP